MKFAQLSNGDLKKAGTFGNTGGQKFWHSQVRARSLTHLHRRNKMKSQPTYVYEVCGVAFDNISQVRAQSKVWQKSTRGIRGYQKLVAHVVEIALPRDLLLRHATGRGGCLRNRVGVLRVPENFLSPPELKHYHNHQNIL